MAKSKSPTLPDTPQYQEDPRFTQGLESMFGLGGRMTSFDFTGDLSPLAETISTSPEMTKLFMEGLKLEMDPIMADTRQDIVNQLAASGQLESSTTANKLLETEQRYGQGLQQMGTQFGIADIERAMRNRIGLFGTGLDVTQTATSMAGQEGQFKNQWNLANYENLMAKSLGEREQEQGGLFGGLMGGAGGALAGLALAPITGGSSLLLAGLGGAMGGAAGAFGPSGTGMSLFRGGAGMAGGMAMPGSTAGAGGAIRGGIGGTNTGMQTAQGMGSFPTWSPY